MKKTIIISLIALLFVQTTSLSLAVTVASSAATPTTKAASSGLLNQINSLKDKIASKVAQLKLVEKRGIIGTVTETSATQITLNDLQDQTRFVDVDEITKFTSEDSKADFGISDLTKGKQISILGLYNKESRRILARFVDVVAFPEHIVGTITRVDKVNYTITIASTDKKEIVVDIESTTKINSYSIDNTDPVRAGFSKMSQGEKVMVIGKADTKEKNRVSATRILLFPDFAGSAGTTEADSTPTATSKLTPTVTTKVTPLPTKKLTPTP
ncbi:hypothetical protein BH11PAT1_BH11PAT1_1170 [soil metagenome]